jgi:hypothetical protein
MKIFSDREKEIINKMYSQRNNGEFMENVLWDRMQAETLVLDRQTRKVQVVFPNDSLPPDGAAVSYAIERTKQIEVEVVTTANLMKYLEGKGLILTITSTTNWQQVATIGNGINGRAPITRDFPDTRVNALLFEYLDKRVFVTPELDDLVQNKFVSREDRQFQKTIRLTWIGIVTAVVIGLASIVIGIVSSSKPIQLDPVDKAYLKTLSDQISNTINNEQINKEAANLEKILDYLKRPIKVEVQNDSNQKDETHNKSLKPTP